MEQNCDEVLKDLQERYPEDLNKIYNCYWWCTGDVNKASLTYYVLLKDKYGATDKSPLIRLLAHNSNPNELVTLLDTYLKTCG